MLTAIREGSKGWISGIIIGLIVLTFALFGISSYLEGGSETPIATVNGEEISSYTYQTQLAQRRQALSEQFGGNFDISLLDSLGIKNQVLDQLVETNLLQQYTTEQNFRLTDNALAIRIQQNQAFHNEGKFDPEQYQAILNANQLTPQGYEALERQSGLSLQLQQSIADSAFTVETELNSLLSLQTQKRLAQYAVVPGDKYVDEFDIADEETQKEYESNIDNYQKQARIKVEYLDLSVDALADQVEVTDDQLQEVYDAIKGRLKTAEVRKASHILFNIPADADDEIKAGARELAESVLAEAREGKDFAELAKTHSDDPGSAANGGELGIVTRGQMVKPFEEAVFSMEQDEISELIETQFGLHIIKLTELSVGKQQTLEEAKQEVVEEAKKRSAEEQFAQLIDPFQNLIFEQPDSLISAAEETGLEIQVSDWFTENSGQGIAELAPVRSAAFSEAVLDEGLNSTAIEIGFDRIIAVRKAEYEETSALPFDDVKAQIVQKLALDRSKERVAKVTSDFLEGLTHLASWDIKLAQNELSAAALPEQRNDIEPSLRALADVIYAESAPAPNKPQYGQVVLPNGDAAIYALTDISLGELADVDDAAKDRLTQQLVSRDGNGMMRQLVSQIRAEAEVVIDEEQL